MQQKLSATYLDTKCNIGSNNTSIWNVHSNPNQNVHSNPNQSRRMLQTTTMADMMKIQDKMALIFLLVDILGHLNTQINA